MPAFNHPCEPKHPRLTMPSPLKLSQLQQPSLMSQHNKQRGITASITLLDRAAQYRFQQKSNGAEALDEFVTNSWTPSIVEKIKALFSL